MVRLKIEVDGKELGLEQSHENGRDGRGCVPAIPRTSTRAFNECRDPGPQGHTRRNESRAHPDPTPSGRALAPGLTTVPVVASRH
jgi:hypothetical protein